MLDYNNNNMDIPSPIDLRDLKEARIWAEEANLKDLGILNFLIFIRITLIKINLKAF